jgi:hypothetical protein
MRSYRFYLAVFFAIASVLFPLCSAQASLNLNLGTKFNGDGTMYNPGPWVTVSVADVAAGQVDLTISTVGLSGGEKVGGLYLNLDPALNPADLAFSAATMTGSFEEPTRATGYNNQKADGDGYYDIQFTFNPDGPSKAFNGSESLKYTISLAGLSASSFNFLSGPPDGGGTGPFLAVVDLRSPSDVSGTTVWATTPEPTTIVLLGLGAFALRRRK